ncbi:10708_t:CDS:1, partial [Cetraspora pellucida]
IELGEEVSRGVYKGKCIHYNKKFKHAKPTKTRAHITHEYPNCSENLKRYYNYIIANNLFDDSKVEDYTIPTHLEIKLFKFMDY